MDEDGNERWRRNLAAPVQQVMAADLDGDAKVVAGCEDGSVWVLGRDGAPVASHRTDGSIHVLAADGRGHLILGGSGGTLSAMGL
ncbi:MAG: PQQ-binding-like beta-propeller repeat protein [Gemmatimonadota bacterium]|nr:PQQ-binding-like beta-propeller repeat protein [Gemmatimonadota bacterium]